jgi:NADP-dependent 3-hydroxy acid dehydrogenase YdfG
MTVGPAEAFTPDQLLQPSDINGVGAQRVNRAALPSMRAQRPDLLLWVGSTSAHRYERRCKTRPQSAA